MAEETKNTQVDMDTKAVYTERKRLLFLGLPWTFTKYTITPSLFSISQGLFNTVENDCYMYKIQDVKMCTSLIERIFRLSTLICYTGDVTHPELRMIHIKNGKEIKAYLLKTSEQARLKRRTLNTVDIGAQDMDLDNDGVADL